jgi:hypothetical protein
MEHLVKWGKGPEILAWLRTLPLTLTVKDYIAMLDHQTRQA